MLRTNTIRLLDDRDAHAVLDVLARDPVANVFVTSRVEALGLDSWRLGAEMWGYADRATGRLAALCYSGANLVPVGTQPEAVHAFAERARRQGRRCSSIVGPRDAVGPMWRQLLPHWGEARDVRPEQPLMATSRPSAVAGDERVRRVRPDEIDLLMPACVAMFTEEVGVPPDMGDGGAMYRSRVAELIAAGRAFAIVDEQRVVFKAEVGAVTEAACQVQGVWVEPRLRGRGIGTAGMAALVDEALSSVAPIVSLYVNDYNVPARRAYEKVGFTDVGCFMSVLF
ncbi:MAG: GNAT family N-acetyltransferase [Actinomycetes bacterium]